MARAGDLSDRHRGRDRVPHFFDGTGVQEAGTSGEPEAGSGQLAVRGERGAEVRRVLWEGAVEVEARSHRSRLLIGPDEGVDVHRGRSGGMAVEEVLQVLPLPPGDQGLREVQDLVEGEVPLGRTALDPLV